MIGVSATADALPGAERDRQRGDRDGERGVVARAQFPAGDEVELGLLGRDAPYVGTVGRCFSVAGLGGSQGTTW
jgi:hypothetical protein